MIAANLYHLFSNKMEIKKKHMKFIDLHTKPIPMAIRIYVTGGTFDKEYNKRTRPAFLPGYASARNALFDPD